MRKTVDLDSLTMSSPVGSNISSGPSHDNQTIATIVVDFLLLLMVLF